jgi:pimeloyl-ACP methyl ester carboxylesterase
MCSCWFKLRGLIATKFAAKYPECVSALYLDAPVMNILFCPAALGEAGEVVRNK